MAASKRTSLIARMGLMIAAAFILSYIESLIPPISSIPGIKAGLANIPMLVALYIFGLREAAIVNITRIILAGITFNGLPAMVYSLAGAVLCLAVMFTLKKIGKFSLTAVSVAGGVCHNIGQLLASCIMIGMPILNYMPILIISGAIAGALVGIVSTMTCKHLRALRINGEQS